MPSSSGGTLLRAAVSLLAHKGGRLQDVPPATRPALRARPISNVEYRSAAPPPAHAMWRRSVLGKQRSELCLLSLNTRNARTPPSALPCGRRAPCPRHVPLQAPIRRARTAASVRLRNEAPPSDVKRSRDFSNGALPGINLIPRSYGRSPALGRRGFAARVSRRQRVNCPPVQPPRSVRFKRTRWSVETTVPGTRGMNAAGITAALLGRSLGTLGSPGVGRRGTGASPRDKFGAELGG